MGLFGRRRGAAPDPQELSTAEAFAGIAVAAMYADGVMGADEDEHLAFYLGRMRVFADLSEMELREAFVRVNALAGEHGDAKLVEACAQAVPERLRATAFLMAADLVMGDADYSDGEARFIEHARQALGVDEEDVARILDVLRIKHLA